MTSKDTIYIVIILLLIFIIVSNPKMTTVPVPDQRKIDSLIYLANESKFKSDSLLLKVDSLESLKPKIKIKYETIYKDIDRLSADSTIAQLQRIFADTSINR